MNTRPFRIGDMYCGAGGTSTGVRRACRELSRPMRLVAVNHWPLAIETHTRNHPDALHHCVNIDTAKPRDLIPDCTLDLLCASPACTYYSRARGGLPIHDQLRMDPWQVVRWCTDLTVIRLLVENVPEFVKWGPVDQATGKPIKARQGEYFRAWIVALEAIGMRVDWRILNCADYGDATTRFRFFLIGRCDGLPLEWADQAYAKCSSTDMFGHLPRWRPTADILDWSNPGTSIVTRKRPLRPKTLSRIHAGAVRYNWPEPHIVMLEDMLAGRTPDTIMSAGAVEPFLLHLRGTTDAHVRASAHSIHEPMGTITAGGNHFALVMANGSGGVARPVEQPIPALVTGAGPHFFQPIIGPYYGSGSGTTCISTDDPLPAITTKARFGMAQPLIIPVTHSKGGNIARSTDMPLPALTCAKGGEFAMAQPSLGGEYQVDVLYRMLHWRELARATSFDDEGEVYDFAGNIAEITKQIGNAVPLRTAKALSKRLLQYEVAA